MINFRQIKYSRGLIFANFEFFSKFAKICLREVFIFPLSAKLVKIVILWGFIFEYDSNHSNKIIVIRPYWLIYSSLGNFQIIFSFSTKKTTVKINLHKVSRTSQSAKTNPREKCQNSLLRILIHEKINLARINHANIFFRQN